MSPDGIWAMSGDMVMLGSQVPFTRPAQAGLFSCVAAAERDHDPSWLPLARSEPAPRRCPPSNVTSDRRRSSLVWPLF
jgi:hypothetical protein